MGSRPFSANFSFSFKTNLQVMENALLMMNWLVIALPNFYFNKVYFVLVGFFSTL